MASIVLGIAGAAIGSSIGGTLLGISASTIGGYVGSAIGSAVDSWVVASLAPTQRVEGPRLESLQVTTSTEGAVIPAVFGRMRVGGNIIWATDFREETETTSQGGGKGGGPEVETTEYRYYASLAVGICEGPIAGIGRVWADGDLLDTSTIEWRVYLGTETQAPDPLIQSLMGAGATPAYRGVAYAVFEDLPLGRFGNRLPQLTFEVLRPFAEAETAEGLIPAVCMIPASGEFTYATEGIRKKPGFPLPGTSDEGGAENLNALSRTADMLVSLDRLEAVAPACESVSLVVSWFGTDLRAGECELKPGVELAAKATSRDWSVNGVTRAEAYLVSRDAEGQPVYGGTPADFSVVQAIRELKARDKRVTFYPFILMDVPPGNELPDPYSDDAAEVGQPAFPWRGRITCSPAAGVAGSVDKTSAAADQVAAFFGTATASDFSVSDESVAWNGPAGEWGLRRMILHYAHLCAAAGGVDAFLIGTEMVALTRIRSGASTYPAVAEFVSLAAEVRAILGAGTRISYAADWSEYFGHQPQDGTGDVFFHLDPLWADANVDFVAIDNYMPVSDWRDGFEHADAAAGWGSIYDRAYLQSNIEGGEGFDWFYASAADRAAQVRTPIEDGAGKPWVFRYKDIRSWWSNAHYDRPGGVEAATPTAWVPESKPIRFTELGCPAVDRGTNQPNVFYDPKSSESSVPHFSRGWRDDAIARAYLEALYLYWSEPAHNPVSSVYGGRMLEVAECAAWTWDARPFPFFPGLEDVWADGPNWQLGHWLNGRIGAASLPALVRFLCERAGLPAERVDVSDLHGAVEGYAITALESPRSSLGVLARHFGFDAIESEGRIRFVMRGAAPVASLTLDELVPARAGERVELTRGQETELPQALKWSVARADADYESAQVEARRATVEASRVALETFPMAVPPEEAERRCRRALMEAWAGRERAAFALPPSRLALDPSDVVALEHDGADMQLRLVTTADGESRRLEAVRQDRGVYDLPPGLPRERSIGRPVVFDAPPAVFMNLPQITEAAPPAAPYLAVHTRPWPGVVAVYRSATLDGFKRVAEVGSPAGIGALAFDLYPGPVSRFDRANEVHVDLVSGSLRSVTDLELFSGANALALEAEPGVWEVLQAAEAELITPGRYRLSRLLRGQRGTEGAQGNPAPAGARVVVLDTSVVPLPVTQSEIGITYNWRVGSIWDPVASDSYTAATFTPEGAGFRPFSVAHVEQPFRTPRTPGDLTIRWTRRSRAPAADSWRGLEVPLVEGREAYEVEILDAAGTVLRTLSAAAPAVVYTGAAQTEDFGAPLGPGDALDVRIFQLSTAVGRGWAKSATLYF
ncbi:baseplate multidomain protein megatron [Roseovarius salis]|uniref:baseplate multidomain protein megatron n=1 Tax=Roseovarius salis TaxID=3376063 RepID=UPI0037C72F0E